MKNPRKRYPCRGIVILNYRRMKQTLPLSRNRHVKLLQIALKHVCMFENPLPVMENETYIHAQQPAVFAKLSVYV